MAGPKRLLDAAGNEVVLDNLPDEAQVVASTTLTDAIPATVHGFAVERRVGPYPIDAPKTHRRAIYVELIPLTAQARKLCAAKGAERIHACTPLSPEGAALVEGDPGGQIAEMVVLDTLRAAVRLLRRYLDVPRQSFEMRSS